MKHSPLSVTFLNQTLGIGGAETFNRDLLVSLQKSGQVQLQSYVALPAFSQMLRRGGLQVHSFPVVIDVIGDRKGLLKAVVLLPYAVIKYAALVWKNRHTDIFFMTGFSEKLLATPFAKMFGVPTVWVEFGPLESVFEKFGGLPKLLYRLTKNLPNKIIVPSKNTQKSLEKSLRFGQGQIEVIPCGRDLPKVPAVQEIPDSVVCVSRLERGKGQDLLIDAFAQVVQLVQSAKLFITGESSLKQQLQQQVKEWGIEDAVQFLGYVPDALRVMNSATICVFPSVWELEGFGMVTIEAMALGKPIVAFDCGPTPEIIRHQKNGLLAKKADVDDLAKKIVLLLQQKKLRQKLGAQAKEDFAQRFTIEQVRQRYLKVFHEVVTIQ